MSQGLVLILDPRPAVRTIAPRSVGRCWPTFANRMPVLDLIMARFGPTLLLMLPALFFAAVLGIVLGLAAAPRAGSLHDSALTAISLFGYSVPVFWLGQMLVIVFRWSP